MITATKNVYLYLPLTKIQVDINVESLNEMAEMYGYAKITQDTLDDCVGELVKLQDYIDGKHLTYDNELDYTMEKIKSIIWGDTTKKELTHLDEIKNTLSKITGLEIGNITDTQYLELLQLASSYKNIQLNSYKDMDDFRASVLVELANIYVGSKAKYPILRQIKNILKLS